MRKIKSATVRPAFKVVPLEGYRMVKMTDGLLVINDQEPTNNVIVDAEVVAGLLVDLARGGALDQFQLGLGTMWTVERVWDE